jgi:hypothetical protein
VEANETVYYNKLLNVIVQPKSRSNRQASPFYSVEKIIMQHFSNMKTHRNKIYICLDVTKFNGAVFVEEVSGYCDGNMMSYEWKIGCCSISYVELWSIDHGLAPTKNHGL